MIKNIFQSYIQFNFVHRDNRYKFLEVSHTHVLSSHMVTMDVCSYPPPFTQVLLLGMFTYIELNMYAVNSLLSG